MRSKATEHGRLDANIAFVSNAPIMVSMYDAEGRVLAASPPFLAAVARPASEVIGQFLWDVFPGTRQGFLDTVRTLVADPSLIEQVQPFTLPSGREHWIRIRATGWEAEPGKLGGFIVFSDDITAQHVAEEERRRAETLLGAVIENSPDFLTVQDLNSGKVLLMNRAMQQRLGAPAAKLIGRPLDGHVPREMAAISADYLQRARSAPVGEPMTYQASYESEDGLRHVQMKAVVIADADDRKRLLTISEDVTERWVAAEALQAAVAAADAANEAKTNFIATVSHEIRTPLNGVLGMAQAMAQDELSEAQRERLNVIQRSGEALLSILNDVLDLSKIEAGMLAIETIEFDLGELMRDAVAPFVALLKSKPVLLVLDVAAAEGRYLGDPARLRQIVSNLVSNAAKFTERGEIRVQAVRTADGVRLTVQDTGIGMSKATLDKLFSKFVQAEASTSRHFGGTGLGLSICRDLAELMGGAIRAESTLGEGSRFIVDLAFERLPDSACEAHADAAAEAPLPARLRVLAADDNAVNRTVLKALLEQLNVDVELVEDGAQAVEAWAGGAWDIVLLDSQMPVMDGMAAAREIRRREIAERRRRTPIVALSANAMKHHEERYLAAGMDAMAPKPIQLDRLLAIFQTVLETAEPPSEARAAEA